MVQSYILINILIYIGSLPCSPFKTSIDTTGMRKSLLSHPEVRSFTSRTSWFDTPNSLVSHTEVPCFKAHPNIARSSSPVGESTSSSLSSNRFPVALSLAPGLPPPIWTTVSLPIPTSNQNRKGPPIPPLVTPDFEFIHHRNPHRFIVL